MSYLNDEQRGSIISYASSSILSKDSLDSQFSIIFHKSKFDTDRNLIEISLNKQFKKNKIICCEQFLCFGPLVLCIILLISGIILFIFTDKQHNKHEKEENIRYKLIHPFNSTLNDSFMPILCPFDETEHIHQSVYILSVQKCGLHRSSLIHIYYANYSRPINPGEHININDVRMPPDVQLNFAFLSKLNYNSFVLILIDPFDQPIALFGINLHWIRYFSLFLEDGYDICHYTNIDYKYIYNQQKIVLLYATNSSQITITAKTMCNIKPDHFQLSDYITFIKLELIGATYFYIPKSVTNST